MKILINTLQVTPNSSGCKTYLLNVLKALHRTDTQNRYSLIVSKQSKTLYSDLDADFVIVPTLFHNLAFRLLFEQLILPFMLLIQRPDLLFIPSNFACLMCRVSQALTVHAPLTVKSLRDEYASGQISWLKKKMYDLFMNLSLKKADAIIVVSDDLKTRIQNDYSVSENKIFRIYEGVDQTLFHSNFSASLVEYKPYILFVSTLFPYKNAEKLLRAFILAVSRYRIHQKLLIIGRDSDESTSRIQETARQNNLQDRVSILGQIAHETLRDFYRNADVFVYPSNLETFGLPILEAMACGTPVLGSDKTSVPEIIGDAGMITNPDDVEEFAHKLYILVSDKAKRDEYISKGIQRSSAFSWDRTAEETLKVFSKITT